MKRTYQFLRLGHRLTMLSLILTTSLTAHALASAQSDQTGTPIPTVHASSTAIPTNTPHPTETPTIPPTVTISPTIASTFIATPAPPPLGGGETATWTPVALEFAPIDHFFMGRPIGADGVNYIARNYPYGATDGGGRPTHHGDDFENPYGTPVLAAASGVVEYAGEDIHQLFGPQPNFYGNVIVIRHPFPDASGQPVFSLYGHLSGIAVQTGQTVKQGEVIGQVGSAGVAIGAHLHFEVRVGDPHNYNGTRNPELWIQPFTTFGAVAGRVLDLYGQPFRSALVQLQSDSIYRSAESYADDGTPGDSVLHENFAISDLPGGYYNVFIKTRDGTLLYRNTTLIVPGKIIWLGDIHIAPPPPTPTDATGS